MKPISAVLGWVRAPFLGAAVAVAVAAAVLSGCNPVGVIQGVKPQLNTGGSPGCCEVILGRAQTFVVNGKGTCEALRIDWGDGSPPEDYTNVDLTRLPEYRHTFTGWGGGKTVTVEGITRCAGKVNTRFTIQPDTFTLAWAHVRNQNLTCNALPNRPALPIRTLVHVTTPPGSPLLVNFGCPFSGCVYDPDGKNPSSATAPAYPFPGFREFSLVLRVGTQLVQGGKDVRFTTTQTGPLEVCANDGNVSDNVGGWEFRINVDMLGPS